MAIQLYRSGDVHEVNGVKCEAKNFADGDVAPALKDGWCMDPKEVSNGPGLVAEEPTGQTAGGAAAKEPTDLKDVVQKDD